MTRPLIPFLKPFSHLLTGAAGGGVRIGKASTIVASDPSPRSGPSTVMAWQGAVMKDEALLEPSDGGDEGRRRKRTGEG